MDFVKEENASNVEPLMTNLQEAYIQEADRRKKARRIAIPTSDELVKKCLVILEEPIIYFGEDPYDRRERLRRLLSEKHRWSKQQLQDVDNIIRPDYTKDSREKDKESMGKESWKPGWEGLIQVRQSITRNSLERARNRIKMEKEFYKNNSVEQIQDERKQYYDAMRIKTCWASQVGGERPLSSIIFDSTGDVIITGDWNGSLKLWDSTTCELVSKIPDQHITRITGLASHPERKDIFASSDVEGNILLWKDHDQFTTFKGHNNRVSGLAFDGSYMISCSHDLSWKLWDIEQNKELQTQGGHLDAIQCITYHPDGNLVMTGSLDSTGRIWDLRSGKSIWNLKGEHLKGIISIDCSLNGYHIATGSEDNTIRIWDLRQLKCINNILAHTALISKVKYDRQGLSLISTSYDGIGKVWSVHGWDTLTLMEGHQGKVVSMDINSRGEICTAGHDRTFKIFK